MLALTPSAHSLLHLTLEPNRFRFTLLGSPRPIATVPAQLCGFESVPDAAGGAPESGMLSAAPVLTSWYSSTR